MHAIEVHELRKSYDGVEAVRGISFTIGSGEVFGLLGPNGAGKTTTVEILEGYRRRDGGEVSVLGVDPRRADSAGAGGSASSPSRVSSPEPDRPRAPRALRGLLRGSAPAGRGA